MTEFWEEAFKDKQEMWGLSPSNSAIATAEFFESKGLKESKYPVDSIYVMILESVTFAS